LVCAKLLLGFRFIVTGAIQPIEIMTAMPEILALIQQINGELDQLKQEATEGLNLARRILERFSDNAMLIQIFAFLNNAVLFAEIEERRTKTISEIMEISSLEEIQEAGEDLAAKLGQVLETKTIVKGIKARLEDLLG
jgi:hypothetical protein